MKASELRGMAPEELSERLEELREELFNLKFKATTEPVADPGQLRSVRKDIARIKTIIREREIDAAKKVADAQPPAAVASSAPEGNEVKK